MLNDKIFAIGCLVALGVAEFVFCFFSGGQPAHTGTIVGAVAGFVTGVSMTDTGFRR